MIVATYLKKYSIITCSKCGEEMKVRNDYLKKHSGICVSCQKKGNKCAFKHGDYKTRLYRIWLGLSHRRYKTYIPKVCTEWHEYEKFKEWAYNNGYNDNLTLDRINNKGDYEPSNCQWITLTENAGKDKTLFTHEQKLEIYNKRKELKITQVEMAKRFNVSRNTIQRLEKEIKIGGITWKNY
jgi:DNA-binding XRE family transcriptional regulator